MINLIAEALVASLLVATIITCFVLSRRIERLKADEAGMRQTVGALITATDSAERAISSLKLTLGDCDRTLDERLRTAERYAADLHAQVEAGHAVMDRIAQIVAAANRIGRPVAEPAAVETSSVSRLDDAARSAAAIRNRAARRLEENAA
ncbi:DUF6468 domain-containing protein [Bosea sp. BH3]|uniref:DUF6468 domain-containing protein n=1 Tax=Bosea sp. BH3 TaxID=2871701 RepID=UPI0021CB49AE|nr:DUF6468 domain-containing protein [Bosea sp. BH3]MCU4180582.1 DUF6468 domain-containing protein [Bosea sp. BH3]